MSGNGQFQELYEALEDLNIFRRLRAAYQLAQHGDLAGQQVMIDALKNKDPEIRLSAETKLGEIGPSWAIAAIGELLNDEESSVRRDAIVSLTNIARAGVVPWLIRALQDQDAERREDARVGLALILGNAVPTASDFEDDEEEITRVTAWWQIESNRFFDKLCYYKGELLSLGTWVASLQDTHFGVAQWITRHLKIWTGLDFGPPLLPNTSASWLSWWTENSHRFKTGYRYFYSYLIDGDNV